jgi:hypothetical protein
MALCLETAKIRSYRLKLINCNILITAMRKVFATIRALIRGEASIDFVDKTVISRTPGDVTEEVGHN